MSRIKSEVIRFLDINRSTRTIRACKIQSVSTSKSMSGQIKYFVNTQNKQIEVERLEYNNIKTFIQCCRINNKRRRL